MHCDESSRNAWFVQRQVKSTTLQPCRFALEMQLFAQAVVQICAQVRLGGNWRENARGRTRVVAGHQDGAGGGDGSRHRGDEGAEAESEDGRSAHSEVCKSREVKLVGEESASAATGRRRGVT